MKQKISNNIIRSLKDILLRIALLIFGRNIKLPTSWNELSELQLKEVAQALEYYHNFSSLFPEHSKPAQYSKLYVQLVKQLLRKNNMFKVWYALRQILPEYYQDYVKFLISGNTRTTFLKAFRLRGRTYLPPANRLQNLSVQEFSFADSLYYNWRYTNDVRYLNLLCATLYRRSSGEKDDVDSRKEFSKTLVEKEAAKFKKLNIKQKLAIAYCFEGSRSYIAKQYPHVFPKQPKLSDKEKEQQKKKRAPYVPFMKLLQYKVKFDPSKLDSTQKLNVHDFLGNYENELIENQNQKK